MTLPQHERAADAPGPPAFLAQLAALQRQFRERVVADAAYLGCLRQSYFSPDRTPEVERALGRLAHSLSGSAGIFGHAGISEAAFQVELLMRAETIDEAGLATAVDQLLAELTALRPESPEA
ncbi:Hpt domain-containing protein [Prosthecodimorpha staleyi]|uniref:Hpt domain-containing protein n=1 Tax=Prosthecodimorpha staleyi TaxID=2840188 RepID=A0A947D0L6_9HYPH|nr:Hpt domain-containing protein [Prosthecodimorpha staleyi]MBT9288391.1 Hpt domain-containing protein [Prosthecodimorpha staleyi]